VRHYDLGHLDIYVDDGFTPFVNDQPDFLQAQLAPPAGRSPSA
jgi:hypothetical protein